MLNGLVLPEDSSVDWAKLAAYIDGEGYICLRGETVGSRSHTMMLRIGNTDPRLTVWLQERFGGKVNRRVASKQAKHIFYQWRVSGKHAAALLEKCLPHFVMKRDQAEIAIAYGKSMGWKIGEISTRWGGRHPKVSDEVRAQRDVFVMKMKEVRSNAMERIS